MQGIRIQVISIPVINWTISTLIPQFVNCNEIIVKGIIVRFVKLISAYPYFVFLLLAIFANQSGILVLSFSFLQKFSSIEPS